MDHLNGRLNGLPKWTTLSYPLITHLERKKKDNQSLVVLIDGPLSSPSCFFFFFLYAAGQWFYRRIHLSHVMADTLGGE